MPFSGASWRIRSHLRAAPLDKEEPRTLLLCTRVNKSIQEEPESNAPARWSGLEVRAPSVAFPRGRRVGCAASIAAEGATAASGGLLRIGAEGQLTSTAPPSSTPAFSTAAGCAS